MNVTLNDILDLVGRLDDASGFDTPRERFRRFLSERVTTPAHARSLIDQSQRALGEQHHRALQDTLVVVGRLLGFETSFGTYQRTPGITRFDGHWRSRRRLEIVLEVRTDQTSGGDLSDLSRSLSMLAPPSCDPDVRHLGLSILTPMYAGRTRLEESLLGDTVHADIRLASVDSLLWLAEMVSAGRLKHHQILRLLTSGASLDFVVELIGQFEAPNRGDRTLLAASGVTAASAAERGEPSYWVATIDGDEATTPEQMVDSVIRRRQILGIVHAGPGDCRPRPGDWTCFLVRPKGIVGHAQVDAIVDGDGLIRGAHRFGLVCRLKHVEVYDKPIAFLAEPSQPRVEKDGGSDGLGPLLAPMSREAFGELTLLTSGPSLDFVVDLVEQFARK